MKPYKWRTRNNGYVYVDSATGSDIFGNGTQENPYQTLGKAWRGHTTLHPSNIVCRGRFCEDMADGTHATTIQGDYYGAAVFDGEDAYTLYGFSTPSMIILNAAYGKYDTTVIYNSPILAGVGRAYSAGHVGYAALVYGVAASSVLLRGSAVYLGCIGGNNQASRVGVVSPKPNPKNLLWFGGDGASTIPNMSVYDVPKQHRRVSITNQRVTFSSCIFGKCAFFVNDVAKFNNCTFASDCEWWNGDEQFTPSGDTNEERLASLREWIAGATASGIKIDVTNCVISDKSSDDIWNDPANGDLTLKYENFDEDTLTSNGYRGAFPPALRVPIMSDSTGHCGTWDENTATGLISVVDDSITVGGEENHGEIKSKVIVTDPDKFAVSGIFAQYSNLFQEGSIQLTDSQQQGEAYHAGDVLPIGRYKVSGGGAMYGGSFVAEGEIIVVTEADTSFSEMQGYPNDVLAIEIQDANAIDNMWLRSAPIAYALVKASDGLQQGATYINLYGKPVTYRGRTIISGESFEAVNSADTFACEDDAEYKIGVLFDDTRVPQSPWIPAQMWGEYFAGMIGRNFQLDNEGNPLGSGNYLAWIPNSEGGYSSTLRRSRAQARYIQLMIVANRK